jgi:tRNA(fMet)-specific endonuclease VapC
MNLVLDTNAYSDFQRDEPRVVDVIRTANRVYLPIIAIAELQYGFALGNKPLENRRKLSRFLSKPRVAVLEPDITTAEYYGEVAAYLHRHGGPIPQNDMWIAALTLQHGYTLCTADLHFQRLPDLHVVGQRM